MVRENNSISFIEHTDDDLSKLKHYPVMVEVR